MSGQPQIPKPPIPSKVRMGKVDPLPEPKPKLDEDGLPIEVEPTPPREVVETVEEDRKPEPLDGQMAGQIRIEVFRNAPYKVEFEGRITGNELDLAWRAMMKQYRVWKHNLYMKSKEESNGKV